MPKQKNPRKAAGQRAESRLFQHYCSICNRLFGKTFSVMAGDAAERGKWYGRVFSGAINWLLREPGHCAEELSKFNTFLKHKRFLLSLTD